MFRQHIEKLTVENTASKLEEHELKLKILKLDLQLEESLASLQAKDTTLSSLTAALSARDV